MTHVSDFSYLERCMTLILICILIVKRISDADGWKNISLSRLASKEPRAIVCWLLFLSLTFHLIYDLLSTYIKYLEGYYTTVSISVVLNGSTMAGTVVRNVTIPNLAAYNASLNGTIRDTYNLVYNFSKIVTKPKARYDPANIPILIAGDFCANIAWSTKSASLLLINLTWNHISKGKLNGKFIESKEVIVFKILSMVSLVLYPVLQWVLTPGTLQSTIAPQFVENFENCAIAYISILMGRRFDSAIVKTGGGTQSRSQRLLQHFSSHNYYLAVFLILDAFGLFAINVDLLTIGLITNQKILLDIFTKFYTLGITITYYLAFLLLFPLEDKLASTSTADDVKKDGFNKFGSAGGSGFGVDQSSGHHTNNLNEV